VALIVALGGVLSGAAVAPKRFALVVGIESYPGGEAARLKGCLLDAEMFRRTLVESSGFAAGEIEMLLDRRATRAGILEGIERQLRRAARGDLFVFYYSGHGTVFLDRRSADRDETRMITPVGSRGPMSTDRYDTSLVPVDVGGPTKEREWGNLILDDELYALFSRFTAAGCHVVFVSDSCFSGSLARDVGAEEMKAKYLPPDLYFKSVLGGPEADSARDAGADSHVAAMEKAPDFAGRYLVFGSSSDTQTSMATPLGSHFTLALSQVVRENPRQSYQQVFEQVRRRVTQVSRQQQEPQLDARFYRGSTGEPFLSLPRAAEAPPVARPLTIGVRVTDFRNRGIPETAVGLFPVGTPTGQGQVRADAALFLGRTNAKGEFISEKTLPPGAYRLKVVHRDYQKFEGDVEIRESRTQPGAALIYVRLKPE
jgi:Caspase domain